MIETIIRGITGGVSEIGKTFFGSKQQRDRQSHTRDMAVHHQYSQEFRQINNRTGWDSFIDGLNRLPRPVIVGLVIGYFLTAYYDPVEFQKINVALDTVPDTLWYVLSAIIGFYFAARELHKIRDKRHALDDQKFATLIRRQQDLDDLKLKKPNLSEDAFQAEMKDNSKPLSNAALLEWNRRYQQK